ncbi:MAG: aminoacyl-histidine dipeptidase [Desulfobacterales bacterium]|nr:aminoacyl-histidine dipeptidase [Desulfobacterales bacterium]
MTDQTERILELFQQINAIPRCSKNEEAVCRWIGRWAHDRDLAVRSDAAGNLVIEVPASPGFESAPIVVFQGHVDMVCEKTPESAHDFSKDPIRHVVDGDWLCADQTSLGADNGVAVAMGMALAMDDQTPHPPLELLFTVDEETGLTGAQALAPGFVKGRILLNVDSEDEGVFTVGCAGGRDSHLTLPLERGPLGLKLQRFKLAACGMHGGHSGIDINKHRASANKILARGLDTLWHNGPFQLVRLAGGTTHNAIAREAEAVLVMDPARMDEAVSAVLALEQALRFEYRQTEPNLSLLLSPTDGDGPGEAVTESGTRTVIDLLLALPHGVSAMSADIPGLVETSANLAVVDDSKGPLKILHSKRSAVMSRLAAITADMNAMARMAGASVETGTEYPAWEPDMASSLLDRCKTVYQKRFAAEATVEIIHAGLECAIIGSKYSGMDMISFGPTMENPHSPMERLYLPSISRVWDFIAALMESYRPQPQQEGP